MDKKRFNNWTHPEIEEGVPSKYNWVVQNINNFKLGFETDIGAFTYINAKYGVIIGERVQIGSHCSIYSISSTPSFLSPGFTIPTSILVASSDPGSPTELPATSNTFDNLSLHLSIATSLFVTNPTKFLNSASTSSLLLFLAPMYINLPILPSDEILP